MGLENGGPRAAPIGLLIAYAAGVLVCGALLAYPVHLIPGAGGLPFHKLVFRLLEACALLGLWPLLVALGCNTFEHWGLVVSGRCGAGAFFAELGRGLGTGVLMLCAPALVLLALGVRTLAFSPEWGAAFWGALFAKALLAGLVVAAVEELWFRGALFSALARIWNGRVALVGTSIVYAAVHFVRPDVAVAPDGIGWLAGFEVVSHSFQRFADPAIWDSFLALTAAGVLLGQWRGRSGGIAGCIGLHAGWVMVILTLRKLSQLQADSPFAFLVGGFDGVIGLLSAGWFALIAALWHRHGVRAQAQ